MVKRDKLKVKAESRNKRLGGKLNAEDRVEKFAWREEDGKQETEENLKG